MIKHHPDNCTGCGLCELMCSLYHEGEQGQRLSRCEITGDRLTAEFTFDVCQQCVKPGCYDACPKKDKAFCIDEATGIKYINPAECDGCGACIEGCVFTPARIKLHPGKNIAFMCDLCRGRDGGPICVEYCNFDALSVLRREGQSV